MKKLFFGISVLAAFVFIPSGAQASLSLTAGSNATTTPSVATSIPGFQIVGPAASTTPVKLRATSGTLNLSVVSGVTMTGNGTSQVSLSGTVANLNTALSTLTYTRASTGTDTLEVSLVDAGEVFFEENGHLYKYISDAGTWNAAKTKAEALTLYGATGYLATITSANENAFVTARLTNAGWMGASDVAVEGAWRWVTGPENGTQFWSGASGGSTVGGNYAAWAAGEPNDSGGEDCAQYLSGGSGEWNDLPCGTFSLPGYVAEFGAPGNMPTVVAQNISIVTADVPAMVSLFPANGAANATTTASLTIRFTKTVTAGTGNISIRKSSDDSLVETINVAGSQVTGGGTAAMTIDPSVTLEEGVQYYVTVPATAFKDGSNNFFGGFTNTTTWAFTTADLTAPVITNIAATTGSTTATVTWTTGEAASTRLWYSAGNDFASSTAEANTSSRVTSHSVSLTSLRPCTLYNYRAVSRDAALNSATSTAQSFITTGCAGGGAPASSTSTPIIVSGAGSTSLAASGRTLSVSTPANFTATSSSVIIQVKSLSSEDVLAAIGKPAETLSSGASVAFNVTALINNVTELDSFDAPVTVSYAYTDSDVLGLDERSLSMYHYKDGTWRELDNCTVDVTGNTITCTAPHFSVFAIFGNALASSGALASGRNFGCKDPQASNYDFFTTHRQDLCVYGSAVRTSAQPISAPAMPVRDLTLGMEGEDVRMLQVLLNATGFTLGTTGAGSPGNETTHFGSRTRAALAEYQKANVVTPSVGYFGPRTRAAMKAAALGGLWW